MHGQIVPQADQKLRRPLACEGNFPGSRKPSSGGTSAIPLLQNAGLGPMHGASATFFRATAADKLRADGALTAKGLINDALEWPLYPSPVLDFGKCQRTCWG